MALIGLAGKLWKLDTQFKDLIETFYEGVKQPNVNNDPVSPEKLHAALDLLRGLCSQADEIYRAGKANGLTNRTLVGTSLNSVRVRSDELLDIVESVQITLPSSEIDQILSSSIDEYKRGESFQLADIK